MPLGIAEAPSRGKGKGFCAAGVELQGETLLGEFVGVIDCLVKPLVVAKRLFRTLESRAVSEEAPIDFDLVLSTLNARKGKLFHY